MLGVLSYEILLTSLYSIGEDPQNLMAVVVLAAMGLLTDDEDLIDAALSEIMSLSIDVRHARDPEGAVEDILANHFLAEVISLRLFEHRAS